MKMKMKIFVKIKVENYKRKTLNENLLMKVVKERCNLRRQKIER